MASLHLLYDVPIPDLRLSDEEIFDMAVVPRAPGRTFLDLQPDAIANRPDD
jgi:hypothetical protein